MTAAALLRLTAAAVLCPQHLPDISGLHIPVPGVLKGRDLGD